MLDHIKISFVILLILFGCNKTERKPDIFLHPVTKVHDRMFVFSKEFLKIKYPYSIKSNNIQFGVIVSNNKVIIRYPKDGFDSTMYNDKKHRIYVYPKLIDPDSNKQITFPRMNLGNTSVKPFIVEMKKKGSYYQASFFLPDGYYSYWNVKHDYNPSWYHSYAANCFFIVGKNIPLNWFIPTMYWRIMKYDENERFFLQKLRFTK